MAKASARAPSGSSARSRAASASARPTRRAFFSPTVAASAGATSTNVSAASVRQENRTGRVATACSAPGEASAPSSPASASTAGLAAARTPSTAKANNGVMPCRATRRQRTVTVSATGPKKKRRRSRRGAALGRSECDSATRREAPGSPPCNSRRVSAACGPPNRLWAPALAKTIRAGSLAATSTGAPDSRSEAKAGSASAASIASRPTPEPLSASFIAPCPNAERATRAARLHLTES